VNIIKFETHCKTPVLLMLKQTITAPPGLP